MARNYSRTIKCGAGTTLPKYVFVLSLENRSFDHVYGKSRIRGKDAQNGQQREVNGVVDASGKINPAYCNEYAGKKYPIPPANAQLRMPGDPKHEYEHILCQTCGPDACASLYKAFTASPTFDGTQLDPGILPVPQQSFPYQPLAYPDYGAGAGSYAPPELQKPDPVPAPVYNPPDPDNSGFVHSWVRSYTENVREHATNTPNKAAVPDNVDEVMRCFDTKAQLPVLYDLASHFVLCDRFFSSLPGPTAPNRFFMMAGSAGGFDHSPTRLVHYETTSNVVLNNGHIFQQLKDLKVPYMICGDDHTPMAAALEDIHPWDTFPIYGTPGLMNFSLQSLLSGKGPVGHQFPFNFVWIEPDYDTVGEAIERAPTYYMGNSMHPCSDVTRAEKLIHDVYTMIRNNDAVWSQCVLFITWDEHGGFYDHVPAPEAPPPGDVQTPEYNDWGFKFDRFGVRVPTLLISPLTEANVIDGRTYDHTSILATVRKLYNKGAFTNGNTPATEMKPMTARDAAAQDFLPLFNQGCARSDAPMNIAAPGKPAGEDALMKERLQEMGLAISQTDPPTGSLILALMSAVNLHKRADPTLDVPALAATLTTVDAAQKYIARAVPVIEAYKAANPNPLLSRGPTRNVA